MIQDRIPKQTDRWTARRDAFSIVELLVVLGVIGVLMAILLPAVQAVRASARSTDCKNRQRQIGLAYHNSFSVQGSSSIRARRQNIRSYYERNDLYLWICPSSGQGPEELSPFSVRGYVTNYLRVISGTATDEMQLMVPRSAHHNGFFPAANLNDVHDGTAYTVCMGDTLSDFTVFNDARNDIVDHWQHEIYDDGNSRHLSELSSIYGSTGVPINALKRDHIEFAAKELALGSRHAGGINALFVDGHVDYISETILPDVWSGLGTIQFGEPVFEF